MIVAGSWLGMMGLVMAIAGAVFLAKQLSLEPAEIEVRARRLRGGIVEYYHRRKTKRDIFLLILIGIAVFSWPSTPRVVMLAFGIYATLVVVRLLFRGIEPVRGGLNLPPPPPPKAPAADSPVETADATHNQGASPLGKLPTFAPAGGSPPRPQPRRANPEMPARPSPASPFQPPRPPSYPSHRPPLSIGGMVASATLIGLALLAAVSVFFFAHEVRPLAIVTSDANVAVESRLSEMPPRLRRNPKVTINNRTVAVNRVKGEQRADDAVPIPRDLASVDWHRVIGKRVAIESEDREDDRDCEADLLRSVAELLPLALQVSFSEDGDEISAWKPSREAFDDLLTGYEVTSNPQASERGGSGKKARLVLDLTQDKLNRVYERFVNDRRSERSFLLARTYAGGVMLLGGLSILLRLGTGRRPPRP